VDLESGQVRTWLYRDPSAAHPAEAPPIAFSWDGRLLLGGNDGVFRWEPGASAATALLEAPGRVAWIDATPDGRWLAAVIGRMTQGGWFQITDSKVVVFDLTTGAHRTVTSHGPQVSVAALDPGVRVLVTGDTGGRVRVGPASGETPRLLVGHTTSVTGVAVSPDGKWIASAAGAEIRLWPMPDLSQPPFHTLPHAELMARLRALKNLRAVDDPASATGYKLDVGPFPGWRDVPTW